MMVTANTTTTAVRCIGAVKLSPRNRTFVVNASQTRWHLCATSALDFSARLAQRLTPDVVIATVFGLGD